MAYDIPTVPYCLKLVQRLKKYNFALGHKDLKTTLDVYTHVTKKAKASTIEKFENYISN